MGAWGRKRHVEFEVWNAAGTALQCSGEYDSTVDFGDGTFGLYAHAADVQFDDFSFTRLDQTSNPAAPRFTATAKTTLDTGNGNFKVESPKWGGTAILEWAGDDAYIAQADVDPNGGDWAEFIFRQADPDNYYAVHINTNAVGTTGLGDVELRKVVRGKEATLCSHTYTLPQSWPITIKRFSPAGRTACPPRPRPVLQE